MSELLGVLESLETMILDAKRLPFTNKVVIPDQDLLHFVDKLRILAKTEQHSVTVTEEASSDSETSLKETEGLSQLEDLIKAKEEAKKITTGANEYADNVLAHLQLLVTKMHKNLIRLEKNIDDGRLALDESKETHKKEEIPTK